MNDQVKVLRVILYTGSRKSVEETVSRSIHGTKQIRKDLVISAFSLNEFPEKLLEAETLSIKILTEED